MSNVIIGDILPYTQATAIASQTVFGTNWTANAASDVVVYQRTSSQEPDDATQILSYPSQYSVSFIGGELEVQVTLVTPANAGDIITIIRNTPADRQNLYSNTNFVPSMLNNDFGILTLVDQQAQLVDQKIGPRYNYSATINDIVDTILPILEANQTWVKNPNDDAIIPYDLPANGIAPAEATYVTLDDETSTLPNSFPLSSLANGILAWNDGTETIVSTVITGAFAQIDVTNGDGIGGTIDLAIADNPKFDGNEGIALPTGTTAQRPSIVIGTNLRFNTDLLVLEYYDGTNWVQISEDDGVLTATGTENQVLVNGTFGVPQDNAIILSLPQDIATVSSPTFAGLTLTGFNGLLLSSSGVLSAGNLSGDVTTSNSFVTTISNQAVTYAKIQNVSSQDKLLGRYDVGAGSVQELGIGPGLIIDGSNLRADTTSLVGSIIGTQNQVLANGTFGSNQTGDVTLTLPQSIATTSNVEFSSLKLLGTGTESGLEVDQNGLSTINGFSVILYGDTPGENFTVLNGIASGHNFIISIDTDYVSEIEAEPEINVGPGFTLDDVFSIYAKAPIISSGTVTRASSLYVEKATGAETNYAARILGRTDIGTSGQFSVDDNGIVTSGTWNGAILSPIYGGTGINNSTNTITLGGNILTHGKFQIDGAFDAVFTLTDTTSVTFPSSGTLATTSGTVASITGTANQVLVNGTSGSAQTGAVTLTLPQSVATTSNVDFNTVSALASNGNFEAFSNNASTTFGSTALGFYIRNSSAVVNNWMGYGFLTPAGNIGAAMGCQMTAQTATEEGDLVLFTRNNSIGLREGARLIGNTNKFTLVNPLNAIYGGTDQSSYTTGDLLQASASNTLSKLAAVATGNALISGGVATASSWGKIGLTTHISGTLGVGNGGTGSSTTFTTGSVVFAGASGIYTQDNTNFFWDDTNNRLGIRTTSPQNPLEVVFSDTNTAPFTGNSGGIAIRNSNNTNNNWVQLWFLANDGLISSSISVQVTDQTNRYGDLAIYTRSAGTGLSEKIRFLGGGPIKFTSSTNFSANGTVATTLTSVGPTGANTTIQEWLTIQNASGTTRYIPCY